jgi:uncharacterized RDD family membrane protein YckC
VASGYSAPVELYQEDRELVPHEVAHWRGYALSGWWRRVAATLIDAFIVVALATTIALGLGADPDAIFSDSPTGDEWLWTAGAGLASLGYFPWLMRATDGGTLGKMALRIRVVRTDGRPMSLTRAFWREVIVKTLPASIPWVGWILALLDDLWPLWDPQNRAIHDFLAGTRVVRADIPLRPAQE